MVRIVLKTVWKCPYCHTEYENEDDAEDCAKECRDIDSPEEEENEEFICECCGQTYCSEKSAEICEKRHSDNQDYFWERHQAKIEKEKLERVSFLPGQRRLNTILENKEAP